MITTYISIYLQYFYVFTYILECNFLLHFALSPLHLVKSGHVFFIPQTLIWIINYAHCFSNFRRLSDSVLFSSKLSFHISGLEKMYTIMSYKKLILPVYWGIYISLCFVSGWFASGVIDNFLARKTSFSQSLESSSKRPVITIAFQKLDSAGHSG